MIHTALSATLIAVALAAPSGDLISDLPGLTWNTNFKQYSGYLSLSNGHNLHYWFVESQQNPSTDPVVLWLNGGPGCSSLDGLLFEHGPFLVTHNGTLYQNDYAWNTVANVLYLESPIGVGYSYSNDGKYDMNDTSTADDAYHALVKFFTEFSEFKGRDFYITGESYGGVYVPTLTLRILQGMADGDNVPFNLKAFAVGNGLSSYEQNDDSSVWFAYAHGIISQETWHQATEFCCDHGQVSEDTCHFSENGMAQCQEAFNTTMNMIYGSGINWYNIYGDCLSTDELSHEHMSLPYRALGGFSHKKLVHELCHFHRRYHRLNQGRSLAALRENVPCIDSTGADTYLNRADVLEAIHIPQSVYSKQPWTICSDILDYTTIYDTLIQVYRDIFAMNKGIYGMIYNGDTDLACNFLGDEWFVSEFAGINGSDSYRVWKLDGDSQVAGWTKDYSESRISFVTIRGAGHMVPQYKPPQALKMFEHFLANKPL